MIIKTISKVIQQTLRAKERALGRETSNLQEANNEEVLSFDYKDLAGRTTFVRMISNRPEQRAEVIQGGKIYNGVTQFGYKGRDAAYLEDDNRITPIPGIKDIQIEYKGGFKAIREATVNWAIYSMDELDKLTPHFLTVGKTVLLDWGWIYPKTPQIQYNTFYQNGQILDDVFTNPLARILSNKGNYDAIGGVISNFEYTMNDSGGFDCVTKITSVGNSLFDAQAVDKGSADLRVQVKSDGNKDTKVYNDGIINAIINLDRIILHNYFEVPVGRGFNTSYKDMLLNMGGGGANLRNQKFQPIIDIKATEVDPGKGWFNLKNFEAQYILVKKGQSEEYHDVVLTRSSIGLTTEGNKQKLGDGASREDNFVRWGWFEDNILTRYSAFTSDANDDLINVFRSVEPLFDGDGNLQPIPEDSSIPENQRPPFLLKAVRIRNNDTYLLPIDPMKFFLPDQNPTYASVNKRGVTTDDNYWKTFLRLNSKRPFEDPNNSDYGILRNVMINTKEIKLAFGIDPFKVRNLTNSGQIYGSDKVNPVVDIKTGIQKLLSAFSANFHNFWSFEIVEDPFGKNIKVIDSDASFDLNSKIYTTFVEKSNKVQDLGIFKFPAFTQQSIVKSQDLSFKIPNSMAVTALYGSNKNKKGAVAVDTSNENPNLEVLFKNDIGVEYEDEKLKNLQKAYLKNSETQTHKIGTSNLVLNTINENLVERDTGNAFFEEGTEVEIIDEIIKVGYEGSFEINPRSSWWSNWSETSGVASEQQTFLKPQGFTESDFRAQLDLVLNPSPDIKKIEANNRELKKQIDEIIASAPDYTPPQGVYPATGTLSEEDQSRILELTRQMGDTSLTGTTYFFGTATEDPFSLSLLDAGNTIVRQKLFSYDAGSSIYKTGFILPADLNLEIDGTSGITPGEIIQTDYIQKKYKVQLEDDNENELGPVTFFQIFGVTQTVDASGWFTQLSTKMRINPASLEFSENEIETFIEDKKVEKTIEPEKVDPPFKDEPDVEVVETEIESNDYGLEIRRPEPDEIELDYVYQPNNPPPTRPKIPVPGDEEDIFEYSEEEQLEIENFGTAEFDELNELIANLDPAPDPPEIPVVDLEIVPKVIPGCTDPEAPNYNPEANLDDGSCQLPPGSREESYTPPPNDLDVDIADDLTLDLPDFEDFSELKKPDPEPKIPKIKETKLLQLPPKKPPIVVVPDPIPPKLKSTYAGTYNQNYLFVYKVTPWYDAKTFNKKISFYGEPRLKSGKFGNVPYPVRQKFWDENIEAPNSDGVSQWGDNEDLLRAAEAEFVGPRYRKGELVSGEDVFVPYYIFPPSRLGNFIARYDGRGDSRGFAYPDGEQINLPKPGQRIDKNNVITDI